MNVLKKSIYSTLVLLVFFTKASGQDSTKLMPQQYGKQIKAVTIIDFFTTFTAINFLNGKTSDEKNSLYLYYNLTLNNNIKIGKFAISNYYFTEFGFKKFIDSITTISEDQYNFKNTLSFKLGNSRFSANIGTNSKSQYFRHNDYKEDSSGKMKPYLFSSYLSPGYINFSVGIKYDFGSYCVMELGLVNGRKTRIKNQTLFESRNSTNLYGLKKGAISKIEFGLNLLVTVTSHEIFKNLYCENFSQFNVGKVDLKQLKSYKADINNAFHYKFFKHFRLSLRTKCLYDINIDSKPKIINSLTIGFYLNNTF